MGVDMSNVKRALSIVESIANDPEVGAIYKGQVTRLMAFGAFVEIAPGKEGLVHISKLADHRVAKVEDVVNVGDTIFVKLQRLMRKGGLTSPEKMLWLISQQREHSRASKEKESRIPHATA